MPADRVETYHNPSAMMIASLQRATKVCYLRLGSAMPYDLGFRLRARCAQLERGGKPMEPTNKLSAVTLEALRYRITQILPSQIRSCIDELSEEQLWWRPNEQANSVGNLVLHVSGSMRLYLSDRVGGIQYERDRPAEFAERGPLPKQQLLEAFDETIRQAVQVLDSFDTSRFLDATDEPKYLPTVFDLILNISIHLAVHTGQIVYVTKMLKAGSLDELWIHAHSTGSPSVEK